LIRSEKSLIDRLSHRLTEYLIVRPIVARHEPPNRHLDQNDKYFDPSPELIRPVPGLPNCQLIGPVVSNDGSVEAGHHIDTASGPGYLSSKGIAHVDPKAGLHLIDIDVHSVQIFSKCRFNLRVITLILPKISNQFRFIQE
jgi:hypothetical protein